MFFLIVHQHGCGFWEPNKQFLLVVNEVLQKCLQAGVQMVSWLHGTDDDESKATHTISEPCASMHL